MDFVQATVLFVPRERDRVDFDLAVNHLAWSLMVVVVVVAVYHFGLVVPVLLVADWFVDLVPAVGSVADQNLRFSYSLQILLVFVLLLI